MYPKNKKQYGRIMQNLMYFSHTLLSKELLKTMLNRNQKVNRTSDIHRHNKILSKNKYPNNNLQVEG